MKILKQLTCFFLGHRYTTQEPFPVHHLCCTRCKQIKKSIRDAYDGPIPPRERNIIETMSWFEEYSGELNPERAKALKGYAGEEEE